MVLLELAQLTEQRVVLVIADHRVVEDVVAVVVLLDLAPQLRSAPGVGARRLRAAHRSPVAEAAAAPAAVASIAAKSQPRSSSIPERSVRSKWTGVTEIRPRAIAERSDPSSSSNEGSK